MPPDAAVLAAVEAAWTAAFGAVAGRGSVSFVGVATIEVLRFGPVSNAAVRYATVGMARTPMTDPRAAVVDSTSGPRAELVLRLDGRQDSVLRSLAMLASAPAVEGLVLAPDATVDLGVPLWDGAPYTAVLVDPPTLPDVHPAGAGQSVQLLPVVPITATELAYRRSHGAVALRTAWREAGIDPAAPLRRGAATAPKLDQ